MIILTFISEPGIKIPQYTAHCIKALRHYNPKEEIHFISNKDHGFEKVFEKFNVQWFDMGSYDSNPTYELEKFKKTCDLKKHGTPNTTHPSPPNFFYGAMARLFYIYDHCIAHDIEDFWHLENDVLVFYPFTELENDHPLRYPAMGQTLSTFSICECQRIEHWNFMLLSMLKYIDMGEQKFCQTYGCDMFNEMTAAGVFDLNLFYRSGFYTNKYIIDPGSIGQYLGGTNNGHGPGWFGTHHYIGEYIANGDFVVYIEDKKPYIEDSEHKIPVFNLHVHSKNLGDFIDV